MAGRGSRLRPHTLTVPKPLVPIAGKPIVQRLCEDIARLYDGRVEEIAFVIGDFGKEVEAHLKEVAEGLGAKVSIYYQDSPEGTAHAIWMARDSMDGEIIIAFADTLFRANFTIDRSKDGAIWVKSVENPTSFGVVTLDKEGIIQELVEKPQEFISDLAIIGIYYIKDGAALREEIKHLIENDLRDGREYQLTSALESMKVKGARFVPGKVDDWMDCGNKTHVLDTTAKILQYDASDQVQLVARDVVSVNSVIIPPCFIGSKVRLENSVVGPFVSIGSNTSVSHSVIQSSIVGENSEVVHSNLRNSMVGNEALVESQVRNLDVGDFCRVKSE